MFFFVVFFGAFKIISSLCSILFTSMSNFIVYLMSVQFSAKKKVGYIVKSGDRPPVFRSGGLDTPDLRRRRSCSIKEGICSLQSSKENHNVGDIGTDVRPACYLLISNILAT